MPGDINGKVFRKFEWEDIYCAGLELTVYKFNFLVILEKIALYVYEEYA
jgi:hypothetical protein